jgi:PilZ domain-containing protein
VRALPTPPLGGRVQLTFPRSIGWSGRYVVDDVDGGDTVTVRPIAGRAGDAPVGTPCFVTYTMGQHRLTTEAITIDCGPAGAVLQLRLADQRRFPRYRRPIAVEIDVPQTALGLVEGVSEDISLGGLRARVPVGIPTDRRAFVALGQADAQPILVAAKILTCAPSGVGTSHVVRVEFTLVSPDDQARLFALVDWPMVEPAGPALTLSQPVRLPRYGPDRMSHAH